VSRRRPTVELRDIATDADRSGVMSLRVFPGQERFVASVAGSFQDAIDDARARPRMWSVHDAATARLVGFVMISDGVPAERLAADDDLIGPLATADRSPISASRVRDGDARRGGHLCA
jgi:hypothetical protein